MADITATLSQRELDAFRQSSDFGGEDPVEALLRRTAAMVRGYCRANAQVAISPTEGELPESLISPAMDYAAYDVLKRMPVPVGEDRRKARAAAVELFAAVAAGRITPEGHASGAGAGGAARPRMADPHPSRLLD